MNVEEGEFSKYQPCCKERFSRTRNQGLSWLVSGQLTSSDNPVPMILDASDGMSFLIAPEDHSAKIVPLSDSAKSLRRNKAPDFSPLTTENIAQWYHTHAGSNHPSLKSSMECFLISYMVFSGRRDLNNVINESHRLDMAFSSYLTAFPARHISKSLISCISFSYFSL